MALSCLVHFMCWQKVCHLAAFDIRTQEILRAICLVIWLCGYKRKTIQQHWQQLHQDKQSTRSQPCQPFITSDLKTIKRPPEEEQPFSLRYPIVYPTVLLPSPRQPIGQKIHFHYLPLPTRLCLLHADIDEIVNKVDSRISHPIFRTSQVNPSPITNKCLCIRHGQRKYKKMMFIILPKFHYW